MEQSNDAGPKSATLVPEGFIKKLQDGPSWRLRQLDGTICRLFRFHPNIPEWSPTPVNRIWLGPRVGEILKFWRARSLTTPRSSIKISFWSKARKYENENRSLPERVFGGYVASVLDPCLDDLREANQHGWKTFQYCITPVKHEDKM